MRLWPAVLMGVVGCAQPSAIPDASVPDSGDPIVIEEDAGSDAGIDAGTSNDAGVVSCIDDVPLRFSEIPTEIAPGGDTSRYLGARNSVIAWPRYTSDSSNSFGVGEHFEGVQRFGRKLLLTGAGKFFTPSTSHLVIIEMGTRSETGAWAVPAYGHDWQSPPMEDRITSLITLDTTLWHGGGIQVNEDVLAVPLYGDASGSEIRFYRLSDPPQELTTAKITRASSEAKAVALTRQPDGRWVLLAWDDSSLDFFVSNTARLEDGFPTTFSSVTPAMVSGGFQGGGCGLPCGTYQNVNFVKQCDGALFFIGTRNTQKGAPTVPGQDFASLYRVELTGPSVTFVSRREFFCHDQQCNFGAAASPFIQDSTHLVLYGASHWLHDGNSRYNFNEFVAP